MTANIDFRLLQFDSYNSYMTSFIRNEDYRYLSSMSPIRKLVRLGYRSTAKIYDEAEFNKLRAKILEFMNPKVLSSVLYGNHFKGTDAALSALMHREEPNLLHKISVSSYIKYMSSCICECISRALPLARPLSLCRYVSVVASMYQVT